MANLANIVNLSEQSKWDVPVTIHRTKAVPLDNSSYFLNLDDAKAFAASKDNTSFVSQVLNVLNVDLSTVDQYLIMDEDGTLLRIASETDTRALSSEVSKLWADVKGGVNYKGHIKTIVNHKTHEELPLSILFGNFYNTHGDTAGKILYEDLETGEFTWLSSIPVNNGWMYCVSVDVSTHPDKKYVTEDGIELTDRDYIIVHDHDLSAVQLSDINRSNVDIIETQDDDYVRTALLAQISDTLSTDYVSKIAVAKGEALKYSDDNFVKLSGNNEILNGNNRLHGKNWINDLSADIISVDFCKLIDDDFGKILSTRIKDLNANKATVLALALRVNEIIDNAEGLETLPKIDVNIGIVADIASRTVLICEKCNPAIPATEIDVTTLNGVLNALNKTLSRLTIRGSALSLDTRLKNLLSSIDFIESYISQVNYDLSALCVHINNDVSFLSGLHDWLSVELSNRIEDLSNSLCSTSKLSVENLQKQIISNDNDIAYLSNCLSIEIENNIDSMHFKGNVKLNEKTDNSLRAILRYTVLNDKHAIGKDPDGYKFRKGFTYRFDDEFEVKDSNGTTYAFEKNDYILFNKDTVLSDAFLSDLNYILDYDKEIKRTYDSLSNQLFETSSIITSDIEYISGYVSSTISADLYTLCAEVGSISAKICLSVAGISNIVDSLSNGLSNKIDELELSTSQISNIVYQLSCNLSDDISAKYNDLTSRIDCASAYLSSEISSNDNDIASIQSYISGSNSLCTVLSDLEDHYNRTFTKDVEYTHGSDCKVDLLNIFDSLNNEKKFTLMYLSGTLVLSTM